MKNNKHSFKEGLKSKLYLHRVVKPTVYLDSGGELSVYRCEGLLEYSEDIIKIKTSGGVITIFGAELGLNTFSNSEITVNGKISRIDLEGEN